MVNGLSDRSGVVFDDERVVVNAGIMLAVTLGRRFGPPPLHRTAFALRNMG
jgi:mannose-6-phosphate isomerase-like protein (cupin superfamily)